MGGRRQKLVQSVRDNPKDVRFDTACAVAEVIGFLHKGGSGDHRTFARPNEPVLLNFQNRNGRIKPYQAKQLVVMIDKYWDGSDE